jgi:hypothetical protein
VRSLLIQGAILGADRIVRELHPGASACFRSARGLANHTVASVKLEYC